MERAPDNERFYELIWPHADTVLRMALALTNRHQAEAEDVAQETMLKAFRSLGQYRPGTDARSWLLAILRNAWVDRVRSRRSRREAASVDEMLAEPAASEPDPRPHGPEEGWERPEELLSQFADADIIAALGELPDDTRWALLLVDVQGMDQAEAADVMGVALGTVKSRVHRGRRQLRDLLLPRAKELGFLGRAGGTEVNR